jgi:hypothetical protein
MENNITDFLKELKELSDKYKIYFVDLCHIEFLRDFESHYRTTIVGHPDKLAGYTIEPLYDDIKYSFRRAIPIKFNIVCSKSREHIHFINKRRCYTEFYKPNELFACSLDTGDKTSDET